MSVSNHVSYIYRARQKLLNTVQRLDSLAMNCTQRYPISDIRYPRNENLKRRLSGRGPICIMHKSIPVLEIRGEVLHPLLWGISRHRGLRADSSTVRLFRTTLILGPVISA